jgi:hypothetical protein
MAFDDYYGLKDGMAWDEQFARFLLGTSPKAFHVPYLDLSYVNVKKHRGPSSSIGVTLCAAVVGMETLRLCWGGRACARRRCTPSMTRGVGNGTKDTSGARTATALQKLKLAIFRRRLQKLLRPNDLRPPTV